MIVLDTNVFSELKGRKHSERLILWLDGFLISEVFLTTITLAETRYGLGLLPEGARKEQLTHTYRVLEEEFEPRTLAFSAAAAHRYGEICAHRHRTGHPIETKDAMIAAICLVHGASLATRNTKDFEGLDLRLVNPFEGA
ncbi:putative nucleic acid-binding protein [Neorhizobium galegae]|uniref:type II toxin-antitoxin system VapC family toxin n=1 Tax=Neorhizobium galegae TaxID=399 RepID=UPI001AE22C28|nr:type II toxin-antitoxin system VapC family toxin [Neorhizobium galegae]MBP2548213.1 putative nucleic acid-binding protein [Neorhizobium galegae]